MVSALIALALLGLLIVVHELGHFVVARRSGVRILRFSVGFGPRLVARTRGHTEYALSAIPLGGYVKMAGEQRMARAPEPWEFRAKPVGTRAAIIIAGPLVNYLVAFLSLWAVFVIGYPELLPEVGKVLEGTPAQAAGIQVGDRIRSIDGRPIRAWDELTEIVHASPDRPLAVRVERASRVETVTVTPEPKAVADPFGRRRTVGLIGVAPSGAFEPFRLGPVAAVGRAVRQQSEWTAQTLRALWSLVTGQLSLRDSVTGPIGLVYLASEAVRMGIGPILFLVSFLSLSLAIFNLLPIPVLDGGHLAFLALEKLRGRPISLNVQERAAQVSFVLLVALLLVVCVHDVSRFGLWKKVAGLVGL